MSARRPNFLIYFLHVAAAEGLEQGDVGGEAHRGVPVGGIWSTGKANIYRFIYTNTF